MKLVAQNSARVWGGNEKWLAILAGGLTARGHEVVLSCHVGEVRTRFEDLGFRVTTIRPRGEADLISAIRFASWLERERPDALLLTSWVPTVVAAWGANRAKVKRVIVRQGIVRDFPRSPIRRHAFRRWIHGMIVNSVEISDRWLSTSNGYPGPRVHVVLNGVESRIHEREHLRQQLRAELGISRSAILIGGAGHIFARKGFDALLRAFADAAVPNAHLAIVGDGDARQSLEKLAEDLQIANRTHWLGRRGNADEIIAGFDIFVLTSRNEGMANVMLEAMAAGAPVIALHVSGVETALAPTDDRPAAGWIVADEGALSSTIREVCTGLQIDPVAVNARTNEAHWRIENWFSKDRMIDQCEAILFR